MRGGALFFAQDALNDSVWSCTQLKVEEVCRRTFTMRLTLHRVSKVTAMSKHCARTALVLGHEPRSRVAGEVGKPVDSISAQPED